MKNVLLGLSACMLMLVPVLANAQCTPDESITGLYSPTEQEGLPQGFIYVPYEATIHIQVPTDTVYSSITAIIDSLVLTSVDGLPPGFEYACNPPNCQFPGGSFGCIQVSGYTDDNVNAGTWPIDANFQFHLKVPPLSLPYTISEYSIELDSVAVGMADIGYEASGLFPNPVSSAEQVNIRLKEQGDYRLEVYSQLGSKLAERSGASSDMLASLPVSTFADRSGVYFITVIQQGYVQTGRVIVQR